ncbi:hypothetical protein [Chamaesiphon sp. VAR_48_metabat_135_sub]|uniref:hypothetical protein n=1 Tax=Chamaesiphon sp. VAR_48_metabat_135_sub TaxID=2964699 RepID=UPI00286B82D0|nr:hypothetical protein [Chamaesiphon sp. VAR_48_metabat_135_sub]
MKERTPDENLVQKLAAGKLFRIVSFIQSFVHLCAYIASFVKLIIIEAGGYYDIGLMIFIGITLLSMPLFSISWWLIQHSLKISKKKRFWGYCFDFSASIWSIFIIKLSYFM